MKLSNYIILSTLVMITFSNPALAGKDFFKKDLPDMDKSEIDYLANRLSREKRKITLVADGRDRAMLSEVYKAAQDLDDQGIEIALLLGPSIAKGAVMNVNIHNGNYINNSFTAKQESVSSLKNKTVSLAMQSYKKGLISLKERNRDFSTLASISSKFKSLNQRELYWKDTEKFVKNGCLDSSGKKTCKDIVVFVVYGEDVNTAKKAYKAALEVSNKDIPSKFIWANDHNNNINDTIIIPYVNGEYNHRIKNAPEKLVVLHGLDSYWDYYWIEYNGRNFQGKNLRNTVEDILNNPSKFAKKSGLSQSDIPSLIKEAKKLKSMDRSYDIKYLIKQYKLN